jgi:hypothetical protein
VWAMAACILQCSLHLIYQTHPPPRCVDTGLQEQLWQVVVSRHRLQYWVTSSILHGFSPTEGLTVHTYILCIQNFER